MLIYTENKGKFAWKMNDMICKYEKYTLDKKRNDICNYDNFKKIE